MVDLLTIDNMTALLALTGLEIVLGIDNIVFLAILVDKLEESQRKSARLIGLGLAMIARILLLLGISWIMLLTTPLFTVFDNQFSGKDLILLFGGLFLLWKATHEIHHDLEAADEPNIPVKARAGFFSVILQIVLVDIVFSLDSVITAVGMAEELSIMIIAIILAIIVMLAFAKHISDFIAAHPSLKMLALSFLLLVGVMLVADGFGKHLNRNYLYFAMGFSLFVEVLNLRSRARRAKVKSA
ncbi:MAG: TerC family protein [Bdellovibrionales bacterium]|nr:TerC family protein [Bdellovibrionales bacterium]